MVQWKWQKIGGSIIECIQAGKHVVCLDIESSDDGESLMWLTRILLIFKTMGLRIMNAEESDSMSKAPKHIPRDQIILIQEEEYNRVVSMGTDRSPIIQHLLDGSDNHTRTYPSIHQYPLISLNI